MPNLRIWIEAQLKRGRTKQQIKGFLVRKGYPQAAVAEVDKIAYAVPSAKTLPGNKIHKKFSSKAITLISIVIGIVFLVWLFNALPFFSKQESKVSVPEVSSDKLFLGNWGPKGAALIIIGTPETNRVLEEYYLSSHHNDRSGRCFQNRRKFA